MTNWGLRRIGISTGILAFCSVVYELLLAQLLSAMLGNTILRYSVTIGLYVFSLGLGSLYFERVKAKKPLLLYLIKVEVGLAVLGGVSPFFILFSNSLLFDTSWIWLMLMLVMVHLPIVFIGFLSGLELPLLMSMTNKLEDSFLALGFDYLGMFVGACLFPLFFLPTMGVFLLAICVSFLNLLMAMFLWGHLRGFKRRVWTMAGFGLLVLIWLGSLNEFILTFATSIYSQV